MTDVFPLDKWMQEGKEIYIDREFKGSREEYIESLKNSRTIYVSNIPLRTKEERLWNIFSVCGKIENVVMGVNNQFEFVGFAFIIFKDREGADNAVRYLNIKIDDKFIKLDKDIGFSEKRRFGRGRGGNQLKFDYVKKRPGRY
ncbi:Cbp20 [Ecytonucleospora hepatopenaei]|uniref:Nuclear cap-binding protein subunit 2 n=1 Tax=Ecytonucleospora hepatopenaei TaxID=646526 RepID=A0A1W0E4D2_9MICR|nr:Cbp20 [Ecytonucleospora hepatopenaei]